MSKGASHARMVDVEFLASYPKWNDKNLEDLPQICFCGRSNVGKSSLINAVVERNRLARTSSTPGRTQALVVFKTTMKRDNQVVNFHLVDLPGYGFAKVPLEVKRSWRPMMLSYFKGNGKIRLAVMLVDIRRVPNEEDFELIEMFQEMEIPILPVVTKVDKLAKTKRRKSVEKIADTLGLENWKDIWQVSASERINIDALRDELFEIIAPEIPEG